MQMHNIDEYIHRMLKEQSRSLIKIHKTMEAMKNCDEFEHIQKYCGNKRRNIMKYIYGGNGVEEGKYTYTGLLIHQIDLYKYLISYLKRKNTEGGATMNGVILVQTVIEKIITGIKVRHLDSVGDSTHDDCKYTEIDRKKMEWYCYNNLLDIINKIYAMTDQKNIDVEQTYKEMGRL